jgi:hypothetical protein
MTSQHNIPSADTDPVFQKKDGGGSTSTSTTTSRTTDSSTSEINRKRKASASQPLQSKKQKSTAPADAQLPDTKSKKAAAPKATTTNTPIEHPAKTTKQAIKSEPSTPEEWRAYFLSKDSAWRASTTKMFRDNLAKINADIDQATKISSDQDSRIIQLQDLIGRARNIKQIFDKEKGNIIAAHDQLKLLKNKTYDIATDVGQAIVKDDHDPDPGTQAKSSSEVVVELEAAGKEDFEIEDEAISDDGIDMTKYLNDDDEDSE